METTYKVVFTSRAGSVQTIPTRTADEARELVQVFVRRAERAGGTATLEGFDVFRRGFMELREPDDAVLVPDYAGTVKIHVVEEGEED